jgi:hypothetical protein
MPCYHPIDVYVTIKEDGKKRIHFNLPGGRRDPTPDMKLPCNKCLGCKLEYSRQWAVRCMHEAHEHEENSFITLTYDKQHLPENGTLVPKHLTDFWKRLRKKLDVQIKYYACGEYGEKNLRPHYHACIFGWKPKDGLLVKDDLYYSAELAEIWKKGLCSFGNLTFESAAYVARYTTKKLIYSGVKNPYRRICETTGEEIEICKEFSRMSRGNGKNNTGAIGKCFYRKYYSDMYKNDSVVLDGRSVGKPPRYYDKLMELDDMEALEKIKEIRVEKSKKKDLKLMEEAKNLGAKKRLWKLGSLKETPAELCMKSKINLKGRNL